MNIRLRCISVPLVQVYIYLPITITETVTTASCYQCKNFH